MDSTRDLKTLTLGTLSEPSSRVCLPSTLSYAERMHLKEHDPVEYARYNLVTSLRSDLTWIELMSMSMEVESTVPTTACRVDCVSRSAFRKPAGYTTLHHVRSQFGNGLKLMLSLDGTCQPSSTASGVDMGQKTMMEVVTHKVSRSSS